MRRPRSAFQQQLPRRLRRHEKRHPEAGVELWAMDEHRVGLQPILRAVWARTGFRPRAQMRIGYKWLYVAGFVHPESGRTSLWLLSDVGTEVFSRLLQAFAEEQGVGPKKHVLLVLDQAGWHTSPKVRPPEGLSLVFLPPYSPELQPAEHLWPAVDEPLANRAFGSLAELERVLEDRCVRLGDVPEFVRGLTRFHWWPRERPK
ncbi:MAG TPA: IS630 family transposase [Armatimonadota bacterium]|nr:IS630 family transposase [Armatimonadota bacterium]